MLVFDSKSAGKWMKAVIRGAIVAGVISAALGSVLLIQQYHDYHVWQDLAGYLNDKPSGGKVHSIYRFWPVLYYAGQEVNVNLGKVNFGDYVILGDFENPFLLLASPLEDSIPFIEYNFSYGEGLVSSVRNNSAPIAMFYHHDKPVIFLYQAQKGFDLGERGQNEVRERFFEFACHRIESFALGKTVINNAPGLRLKIQGRCQAVNEQIT